MAMDSNWADWPRVPDSGHLFQLRAYRRELFFSVAPVNFRRYRRHSHRELRQFQQATSAVSLLIAIKHHRQASCCSNLPDAWRHYVPIISLHFGD